MMALYPGFLMWSGLLVVFGGILTFMKYNPNSVSFPAGHHVVLVLPHKRFRGWLLFWWGLFWMLLPAAFEVHGKSEPFVQVLKWGALCFPLFICASILVLWCWTLSFKARLWSIEYGNYGDMILDILGSRRYASFLALAQANVTRARAISARYMPFLRDLCVISLISFFAVGVLLQ